MTVGLASYTANNWLNMLKGTAFTAPAGFFVKLHTADPGAAGTTAAAAGSTTRVALSLASASGGSISLTGTAPSWTNGGTSETLSHISLWDASSAGNFLGSVALSSSQAWASGNTFTLSTFTYAFSPIAA